MQSKKYKFIAAFLYRSLRCILANAWYLAHPTQEGLTRLVYRQTLLGILIQKHALPSLPDELAKAATRAAEELKKATLN